MYGDASGNIGDLAGNFSDSGGAAPGGFDPSAALDAFADANLAGFNTAAMNAAIANQDVGFDPAGVAGLSGKSVQDAFGQVLFDVLSQQDLSTAAGMKEARSTLESLSNLGYGRTTGVYANNPTMSIDQLIGANNLSNIMGYVAPAIANLAPGFGTLSTIGRVGAGLMSGTMTPGQAFATGLAGLIGAKTGIPSGIVEGLFEGNLGKAAGSGVQAGITSGLGPLAGLAFNLSGAGSALNRGVSEAVSGATGGTKSGGVSSLPGAGPAPSTSTAPTGNVYGDAGVTQDISPVLAAIEQEAQQTQPAFRREMLAGRYGPIMQYEFGA